MGDGVGFTVSRLISPGDFDGDGNPDLLRIGNNGSLNLFQGDGAGGIPSRGTVIGSGWIHQTRNAYSTGDFDGDGNSDVILERSDGSLYLYRGNGAGFWINPSGTKIGSGFLSQIATFGAGDMNGDGFSDIVSVNGTGNLRLYPGMGGRLEKRCGHPDRVGI